METKKWLRIAIFNLAIVAGIGTVMRYKIGFEFPYFDQKYLQHAHSHFAFNAWLSHTIYVLMLYTMSHVPAARQKLYNRLIGVNLVLSYGMLISFLIQGYGVISIVLSTTAIFISYIFAALLYKDISAMSAENQSRQWFKAALLYNVLSSIGSFALAYLMMTRHLELKYYLASLYFFFFFQYNGFFTFACFGLFFAGVKQILPSFVYHRSVFYLLFAACVPAYFLSTLWADIPLVIYLSAIVAAAMQVFAWGWLLQSLRNSFASKTEVYNRARYLLTVIAIALSIKFLLQLGSTVPIISKLAFGFRPIVIAYLHLILLGIISVFLLAFIYQFRIIQFNRSASIGFVVLLIGVYLNEIVLAVQGIASFSYTPIPKVNLMLLILAAVMFIGALILVLSIRRNKGSDEVLTGTGPFS